MWDTYIGTDFGTRVASGYTRPEDAYKKINAVLYYGYPNNGAFAQGCDANNPPTMAQYIKMKYDSGDGAYAAYDTAAKRETLFRWATQRAIWKLTDNEEPTGNSAIGIGDDAAVKDLVQKILSLDYNKVTARYKLHFDSNYHDQDQAILNTGAVLAAGKYGTTEENCPGSDETVTPIEVQIVAKKQLTGADIKDYTFTFKMSNAATQEQKNGTDGKIVFNSVELTEAKEYTFQIDEDTSKLPKGITAKEKSRTIKITTKKVGDKLAVDKAVMGSGAEVAQSTGSNGIVVITLPDTHSFKNEYAETKPEPKITNTTAKINGKTGTIKLKDGEEGILTDEVEFSGLEDGKDYTIKVTLAKDQEPVGQSAEKIVTSKSSKETFSFDYYKIKEAGEYSVKTELISNDVVLFTHNGDFKSAQSEIVTVTVPDTPGDNPPGDDTPGDNPPADNPLIEIPVTKVWDDNDSPNRPESVTVTLKGNGKEVQTCTLSEAGGWKGTFTELPKNDAEGNAIEYTVEETAVEYYSTTVEGTPADGFTITNLSRPWYPPFPHTPGTLSEITLRKEVTGAADKNKEYEVIVTLEYPAPFVAEGESGMVEYSLLLTPGQDSKIDKLPIGTKASVREVEGDYETKYFVNGSEVETVSFEVTNDTVQRVLVSNYKAPEQPKTDKPKTEEKDKTPKTGDEQDMMLYVSLMGIAVIGATATRKYFKSK